jgi:hypothetical protein
MFEQPILDTLIVIGMFVLRVGVPVVALFLLATWLEKKLRPSETHATEQRTSGARIIPFGKTQPSPGIPQASTRASTPNTVKRENAK